MAKIPFLKKPAVKNILSALAVAFFGFILLNIIFIFDALFTGLIMLILNLFLKGDLFTQYPWLPAVMHVLFVIIISLISWLVFRSKLRVLFKAIYMTVPLAVVFVTIGMSLYSWPAISYLIGFLFAILVLYYFYRTKQPWIYYFTLILISLVMLIGAILGTEI